MMPIAKRAPRRAPPSTSHYLAPITILAVLLLVGQMIWLNKHEYMFKTFSIERIRCDECGGTGVVRTEEDDALLELCPVCFGVGGHYVRRVDKADRLCPACTGLGRVMDKEGPRTCRRCEGRGLVRDERWTSRADEQEQQE